MPPRDLLEIFAGSEHWERFYWERPDCEEAILALGAAAEIEGSGPSRFDEVAGGQQLGGQLALHQLEGPVLGLLVRLHADDVESELASDDLAHLTRLEREGHRLEGGDHPPALEVAQISSRSC